MTWICYVGIELSAKTQWFLLGRRDRHARALRGHRAGQGLQRRLRRLGEPEPQLAQSVRRLVDRAHGRRADGVFIYWGWDTAVAVNEETRTRRARPGSPPSSARSCCSASTSSSRSRRSPSTGPQFLVDNQDEVLNPLGQDVLPAGLDKLLIIAVLTSASASTQTTILPGTRAALSMAAHGAAPKGSRRSTRGA